MSQTFKKPDFDNAPGTAFCFAVPVADLETQPELLLKTSGVIEHPYWGRIIHDMAGIESPADRYVLDYCHDDNQVLGFVDNIQIVPEGLKVTPTILPGPGPQEDRAGEVLRKSKAGTPYQASLDWRGPASLEWVDVGVSVDVNGGTFEGPGVVARKWRMNGAAICPHGADPNTYAIFSRGEATRVDQIPSVDSANPANPERSTDPQAMSATNQPETDFRAQLKKFSQVFGADRSLSLIEAGTSFEAAVVSELGEVRKQFAAEKEATKQAHDAAIAALNQQLSEAKTALETAQKQFAGEKPLPTSDAESKEGKTFTGAPGTNPMQQFVRFRGTEKK